MLFLQTKIMMDLNYFKLDYYSYFSLILIEFGFQKLSLMKLNITLAYMENWIKDRTEIIDNQNTKYNQNIFCKDRNQVDFKEKKSFPRQIKVPRMVWILC